MDSKFGTEIASEFLIWAQIGHTYLGSTLILEDNFGYRGSIWAHPSGIAGEFWISGSIWAHPSGIDADIGG